MTDQPDFRAPNFELELRDLLSGVSPQRDGHHCTQCYKRIPENDQVGPINIVLRDPEMIGPEGMEREFCTWECLADWAEVQAGRRAPNTIAARNPPWPAGTE